MTMLITVLASWVLVFLVPKAMCVAIGLLLGAIAEDMIGELPA